MKQKLFIVAAVFVSALLAYYHFHPAGNFDNTVIVRIGGQNVQAEVASTPEAQAQGLSGRASLPLGTGMLFVFERPGRHSFWMQDMKFPIDILWLDADKHVVSMQENATPESYPEMFIPDADATYVLEVPAGFASTYGIKIGDRAELAQ